MTRKIVLALAVFAATASVALAASSPSVKTGKATSVKQTSAVLNGTINPNGSSTKYWFEWGLTTSYGSTTAVHTLRARTTPVSVHLTVSGLTPAVTYHYRLVAQNGSGTAAGADRTFKTTGRPLPVAETQPASSITTDSATINAYVDPNGVSTPTEFQWGDSPGALSNTVPGPTVPSSSALQAVSASLSGLAEAHTFYYRVLVYRAAVGWIPASTLYFTTIPFSRPYAGLHVSNSPHHAKNKPFVFTTTGSILGPFLPGTQCSGTVALRYFAAGRQIKERYATVQPDCTFAWRVVIFHTFASHRNGPRPRIQNVQIMIRFRGNNYLAPKMVTKTVVIG